MRRLHERKLNSAVFDLCIPYQSPNGSPDSEDLDLQLDALLLQLNTGEYIPDGEGDTEEEMLGTESEAMLAGTDGESQQSVGSTALLERGIGSGSLDGIANEAVEGEAPLASMDALTPSPNEKHAGNRVSSNLENYSAAELPVTESANAVWTERTDSQGDVIDYNSRGSMPSYPDSTHDFFKPPTLKARETIKRFLKDGEDNKVFMLLNRALKSDLDLDNAILRILDILERRRVDLASGNYIESVTTASLLHTSLLYRKENATQRLLERFPYLVYVNYTSKKYRDQTCFHIAVANKDCNTVSKMLSILPERADRNLLLNTAACGSYFVHERPEASTCLSTAAWMGQFDMIERLVVEGADLELQGVGGNTLLHFIVILSIKNLNMLTARKLVKVVYENCGWWWSDAKDTGTSVDFDILKKQAFQYLMRIPNDTGLTPTCLAVHLHSPLTSFLLSLEPVFKLQQSQFGEIGVSTYDVTDVLSFKAPDDGVGRWHYDVGSVLHTLAHADKVVATDKTDGTIKDVAEMEPLNTIIEMKWKVYRWIYLSWCIVHALFMTILTCTALHHHDTQSDTTNGPIFGLFLPFPLIYLAGEVVDITYTMYRYVAFFGDCRAALLTFFKQQLITTGNIPYRVILFTFSWTMLIWCGMYHQGNKDHVIPLSLSLILGWSFMLFFSRGCRHVCRFSTMVQRMIFRDLLYFLAVYLFILVGFSGAVHVLLPQGQTTSKTFFLMLNVITNMDTSPLGDSALTANFNALNNFGATLAPPSYISYARFVLGVYGIVSAVLLLSLLIAVMSRAYDAVKSSDVNLWRYQLLSISLLFERRFFWWTKLCRLSQNATIIRYTADLDCEKRESRVFMNIQEHIKR